MRLALVGGALGVLIAAAGTVSAQAPRPARDAPVGVRQLRAHQAVDVGSAVIVNGTSDGLVEMTIDGRNVHREYYPREPQTYREFFEPDAVLAWVDSVTMMLSWLSVSQPGERAPWSPTLGHPAGRQYKATAWNDGEKRSNLRMYDCNRGNYGALLPSPHVAATIASFRLAAMDARALRRASPGRPPNATTYYQHAVGCQVVPNRDNPVPAYPHVPAHERLPYQVLAQFVVDTEGRVDLQSFTVPRSTDERFAAAVRAVLPKWRFTPATRRGMRVRQSVHMPIRFVPRIAEARSSGCPETGVPGVITRPVTPDGSIPAGLNTGFFRRIGRALGDMPIADTLAGRTVRFIYTRGGNVQFVRERVGGSDRTLASPWIRTVEFLPLGIGDLPNEFRDDAVEIDVEFTSRCDGAFAVPLRVAMISFVPQYDGTVQISNVDENGTDYLIGEPVTRHDFIAADDLVRWVDTTQKLLTRIDTAAWQTGAPAADFMPNAPPLGYPLPTGLRLWLNGHGMLMGGFQCAATDGYLEVMPEYFARVKRAALFAAAVATRTTWRPSAGERPYFEHELACSPEPARDNPVPVYPQTNTGPRTSVEVVARFVVDTLGNVEPTTIELMPGSDPQVIAATEQALREWRFAPATRAGRRVRALVHVPIVIRPSEADAATLARRPDLRYPEDTIQRTVFYKPERRPPVDDPKSVTSPDEWADAVRAMQPYVDRARLTWPAARTRFLGGLPRGYELFVTARISDTRGRTEQVFIRVTQIDDEGIVGRIQSEITLVAGFRRGDAYTLKERDLIDWTIVRPDGSEEGNVVGKFLDTYRPRRWR